MAPRFSLLRSGNSRYLSSLCRLNCASKIRQSSPTLLSLYFWARSRIFMALSSVLGSHLRKLAHRSRTVLIWYSSASLSKCSTFSTKTSSRINFTFNHIKSGGLILLTTAQQCNQKRKSNIAEKLFLLSPTRDTNFLKWTRKMFCQFVKFYR